MQQGLKSDSGRFGGGFARGGGGGGYLPQRTGLFCLAKSMDSCDNRGVLPPPVGPVNTTSSPRRNPFVILDSVGIDGVWGEGAYLGYRAGGGGFRKRIC